MLIHDAHGREITVTVEPNGHVTYHLDGMTLTLPERDDAKAIEHFNMYQG